MAHLVRDLLGWASEHGIQLHPSLRVRLLSDSDSPIKGVSVFSEQAIERNEIVASIPKTAILSVKSSALANVIPPAPYGLGAQLALSVALSHELARREESKWHGYLQSLPSGTVPIALLWGDHDAFGFDPDGEAARQWIVGTEVERTLCGEEGMNPLNEIREYYHTVAARLLPASYTISHFLRAYSLVSSRAFMVDAYHGLSMVPIADAFNHITENHVHLECDFDVCPLCGSFAECTHDREDAPPSEEPRDWQAPPVAAVPDTCDMVVNRQVPAGSEVFNTYGARKSNAALLAWYGFAHDGNENDVVGWDFTDVTQTLGGIVSSSALPSEGSYKAVLRAWLASLGSMVADESRLVYRPDLDDAGERSFVGPSTAFCVNSDAQLSVYLWVYLAVCAAAGEPELRVACETPQAVVGDVERLVALLGAVMAEQVSLEKALEEDFDEAVERDYTLGGDGTALRVISRIAGLVDTLCQHRMFKLGKHPELSTAQLGEMLDEVPKTDGKTRLAISQVLAERSILEGCQAGWRELQDVL